MHHLESCIEASPAAYIQRRFAGGEDKELNAMERMKLTPEDKEMMKKRGAICEIVDRVMKGKSMHYGCLKTGQYPPDKVEWLALTNLKHQDDYVQKLIRNCDEVIKARNSGQLLRPTTLEEVLSHMDDFGISGDLAKGKIKRMSGGQKARLVLAAAMWQRPHFICLDEPTNYLDNDTLAALTHALKTFRGGVCTISHNEAFVANLCDEYLKVEDGEVSVSDSAKATIDASAHGPTQE